MCFSLPASVNDGMVISTIGVASLCDCAAPLRPTALIPTLYRLNPLPYANVVS